MSQSFSIFNENKIEIKKAEKSLEELTFRKELLEQEKKRIPSTRNRSRVEKTRREAIEKALTNIEDEISKSKQVLRKFKGV